MTADRDATVDVVGDAEQVLSMAARAGPNGATATTTTEALLAIDVTGGNANLGPLGRIFDGQGGGGAQVTWFNGVFDISNHGTQLVFIWIDDGTGTVSFYATTDGHGPVDGNASAFELPPAGRWRSESP